MVLTCMISVLIPSMLQLQDTIPETLNKGRPSRDNNYSIMITYYNGKVVGSNINNDVFMHVISEQSTSTSASPNNALFSILFSPALISHFLSTSLGMRVAYHNSFTIVLPALHHEGINSSGTTRGRRLAVSGIYQGNHIIV